MNMHIYCETAASGILSCRNSFVELQQLKYNKICCNCAISGDENAFMTNFLILNLEDFCPVMIFVTFWKALTSLWILIVHHISQVK